MSIPRTQVTAACRSYAGKTSVAHLFVRCTYRVHQVTQNQSKICIQSFFGGTHLNARATATIGLSFYGWGDDPEVYGPVVLVDDLFAASLLQASFIEKGSYIYILLARQKHCNFRPLHFYFKSTIFLMSKMFDDPCHGPGNAASTLVAFPWGERLTIRPKRFAWHGVVFPNRSRAVFCFWAAPS